MGCSRRIWVGNGLLRFLQGYFAVTRNQLHFVKFKMLIKGVSVWCHVVAETTNELLTSMLTSNVRIQTMLLNATAMENGKLINPSGRGGGSEL